MSVTARSISNRVGTKNTEEALLLCVSVQEKEVLGEWVDESFEKEMSFVALSFFA